MRTAYATLSHDMHLRPTDTIALVAAPLLITAFAVEGVIFPSFCMILAAAVLVFVIAGHDELPWQWRFGICAVVIPLDLGMVVYLFRVNFARELKAEVAPLVAASLPIPVSSNCPIPSGAVALYLGNRVSVVSEFPHLIFSVRGDDVFVVDRESEGVVISFQVYDDSGNLVARLERNVLTAIAPVAHVQRPTSSNLMVFDDRNSEVLDVQFLNPQAIKVTGIFRYPGVEPIVIGEKYVGVGGVIAPPACSSESGADFLFN